MVYLTLEVATCEPEWVVFYTSIELLLFGNQSSDLIRVTGIAELMAVWGLEIVVHLATLLLLSKGKVDTFKLRCKGKISLLVLQYIGCPRQQELVLRLRNVFTVYICADRDVRTFQLGPN